MKKLLLLVVLLPAMLATACKNENPLDGYTHYYKQTGCADAWGTPDTNPALEKAVTDYLSDSGIRVLQFGVIEVPDSFFACEACHCWTGKTLEIKVSDKDAKKLMELTVPDYQQWIPY